MQIPRLLIVSLALAAPASGQAVTAPITCEHPAGTLAGTRPAFAWQDHFTPLTRLGNHWMPSFGDGDSMTSPFWLDQGTARPFDSLGLQETWYIARDAETGTAPFYRLLGSGNHRDSAQSSEVGYTLNLGVPHGYPWTSDLGGMLPIQRYFKSSINDNRTWLNGSPPADYTLDMSYDSASKSPRFGYPRFGNFLDQCSVINLADATGVKLQNGTLRVGFNPIWGNAVSELTHLASGQQIVSPSIGDMLQAVLWYGGPAGGPILNPTQSGGADCWDYGNTRRWTGSPVLSTTVSSATNPKTLTTTVRPLNFCHNDFQGNDPWSPLAWKGLFRETTTLGCKLGLNLREDVVKVQHEAKKDAGAIPDNPINMNQGAWLRAEPFGDCTNSSSKVKAEVIDLTTGLILNTYLLGCGTQIPVPAATNKGIRLTSADGTFAVGFTHLGFVDQYSFWFRCGSDCQLRNQKLILSASVFHNIGSAAWESDEVFYAVGTPATVLTRLLEIKTDGGSCLS